MLLCYRWTGNTATFQADHAQVHNPVLPTGVLRHKDWNNSPAFARPIQQTHPIKMPMCEKNEPFLCTLACQTRPFSVASPH